MTCRRVVEAAGEKMRLGCKTHPHWHGWWRTEKTHAEMADVDWDEHVRGRE